jgi:Tol biopolymer transport system component
MDQTQPNNTAPPSLLPLILQRLKLAEDGQGPISAQHLQVALAQPDWTLRASALQRVEISPEANEAAQLSTCLHAALHDQHVSVRAAAVTALGRLGQHELLLTAFNDEDWQVREAVVLALKTGHDEDTQIFSTSLLMALDDLDSSVRDTAHYNLDSSVRDTAHYDTHDMDNVSKLSAPSITPTVHLPLKEKKMHMQKDNQNAPSQYTPIENPIPGSMSGRSGTATVVSRSKRKTAAARSRFSPLWHALTICAAILVVAVTVGFWATLTHRTTSVGHQGVIGSNQGQLVSTYTLDKDQVLNDLAWSPNGQRIALATGSLAHGAVALWDAQTSDHRVTYTLSPSANTQVDHEVFATTVSWSPDGKHLAIADGDVQIWDTTSGRLETRYFPQISSLRGTFNSAAWSPDGKYVAGVYTTTDSNTGVCIWDVSTGKLVHTFATDNGKASGSPTANLAWSPNSKYLAVNGDTISVWNATTAQKVSQLPHQDFAGPMAWSPDSTRIATQSVNVQKVLALRIWNALTGTVLSSNSYGFLSAIAWSPDGKHLAISGPAIQILDASNGKALYTYPGQVTKQTNSTQIGPPYLKGLAWSPDSKLIASGLQLTSDGGGNVQVWRAE